MRCESRWHKFHRASSDLHRGRNYWLRTARINAEDGAEVNIRSRLKMLGAARERVFVVDCAENGWASPPGSPRVVPG